MVSYSDRFMGEHGGDESRIGKPIERGGQVEGCAAFSRDELIRRIEGHAVVFYGDGLHPRGGRSGSAGG